MLLVFACALLLLFVMPALLFWLGRAIEANTDGRKRAAAHASASARSMDASADGSPGPDAAPWFRRPMLPAFSRSLFAD